MEGRKRAATASTCFTISVGRLSRGYDGLFGFLEVEKLIHKRQQPVGVAVDYIEIAAHRVGNRFLGRHYLFERPDNQRHRGADFVRYDGEERELGVEHLFLSVGLEARNLASAGFQGVAYHYAVGSVGSPACQQHIEYHHPPAQIPRGRYNYVKLCLLGIPYPVVVRGLHAQCVAPLPGGWCTVPCCRFRFLSSPYRSRRVCNGSC